MKIEVLLVVISRRAKVVGPEEKRREEKRGTEQDFLRLLLNMRGSNVVRRREKN